MKYSIALLAASLAACSSTKNLTKEQSPLMTVRIDGPTLSPAQLYLVTSAVNGSGRFYAVDRSHGFEAATADENYLYLDSFTGYIAEEDGAGCKGSRFPIMRNGETWWIYEVI